MPRAALGSWHPVGKGMDINGYQGYTLVISLVWKGPSQLAPGTLWTLTHEGYAPRTWDSNAYRLQCWSFHSITKGLPNSEAV